MNFEHNRILWAKHSDAETAGYVSRMQNQYEHTDEKPLISKTLDQIMNTRKFADALDVGPGPGDVTRALYDRADRLTLVELNQDYEVTLVNNFPGAEIIIDSIHNLTYPAKFDAILFSHGFYYLDEAEWLPFARRLVSYLKPGGSLYIVMNNDEGDGARIIRSFWDKHPELKTHTFPPWSEFKKKLGTLGELTSHSVAYHWYFRPEETLSVLGAAILAIPHETDIERIAPELRAYADTLGRDGDTYVMNVGADVLEIHIAEISM